MQFVVAVGTRMDRDLWATLAPIGATEQQTLDESLARLPAMERSAGILVARLRPYVPLDSGAAVLDIGAAQGVFMAALQRRGYEVKGIEPWSEAVTASAEVSKRLGVWLDVVQGTAESLPYGDASFNLVHAQSVMEHVTDPEIVMREAFRVLKPGGGLYFYTASVLCPRQNEIRKVPLFPWYPAPLKRRVLDWAKEERPELIGHTTVPAYWWWSPRSAARDVRKAGFAESYDRWELRREEEFQGWRRRALVVLKRNRLARRVADVVVPNLAVLAIKSAGSSVDSRH